MPDSSLYTRLGGAEGIRQIIEDVVAAHLDNPVVGERFQKVEDINNLKAKAGNFFARAPVDRRPIPGRT